MNRMFSFMIVCLVMITSAHAGRRLTNPCLVAVQNAAAVIFDGQVPGRSEREDNAGMTYSYSSQKDKYRSIALLDTGVLANPFILYVNDYEGKYMYSASYSAQVISSQCHLSLTYSGLTTFNTPTLNSEAQVMKLFSTYKSELFPLEKRYNAVRNLFQ